MSAIKTLFRARSSTVVDTYTFCLNGRAYVGNTPTIEVRPGERLRWYLANLDLSSVWHNFHTRTLRWQLPAPPGGAGDVHALSPAESFVNDGVGTTCRGRVGL